MVGEMCLLRISIACTFTQSLGGACGVVGAAIVASQPVRC